MKRIATFFALVLFLTPMFLHAQWQSAGGPDGGRVNGLYSYSGYVYAGTYAGIFRSSDDGDSWEAVYGGINPSGVYRFAVHDGLFFAGTAMSNVLVSTDGGTTWTEAASGSGSHVQSFVSRTSGLYVGSIWGGVTRTTDYGQTWEELNTGLPVPRLSCLAEAGTALLAGIGGGGLYRSTDEGASWTDVSNPAPSGQLHCAVQHQGDVYASFLGNGVYKSTDAGLSWSRILTSTYVYDLISDGARVYGVDNTRLWYTDDGGNTWTERTLTGSPAGGYCIEKIGGRLLVGHIAGGVTVSLDDGVTWSESSDGLRATNINAVLKSGQNLYASVQDAGLRRSTDNGATWTVLPVQRNGSVLSERNGTLFYGTSNGLYSSTDDGDSWQLINGTGYAFRSMFNAPSVMYAGASNGSVLASTDDGVSWTKRGEIGVATDIGSIVDNGTVLMAGTSNEGIFVSTDDGATWEQRNNGLGANPSSQDLIYTDGAWYSARTPGLYRSTDDGLNWQVIPNAIRQSNSYSITAVQGGIVAGTYDGGVYFYDTDDSVWTDIGNGYLGVVVQTLAAFGDSVYLGSGADGLWLRAVSDFKPSPEIAVSPASLDFGTVATTLTKKLNVEVENISDAAVRLRTATIVGPDAAAFSAVFSGSTLLYHGEKSRVEVSFAPSELRSYSAELVISSNDVSTPEHRIALTGKGLEVPAARVEPLSYDFGDVERGMEKDMTFHVYNDGNLDLEVQMPKLVGSDAASFSLTGSAMTIAAADSGSFTVRFAPDADGLKQATVQLQTNDPSKLLVEIPVSGTGVRPDRPEIFVTPTAINFPPTDVGSRSTETIRVENHGGADLLVYRTLMAGTGRNAFIARDGDSLTIVPDGFAEITVEFQPEDNLPYSATLRISSNDPSIPSFPVFLSGLGQGDDSPVIELEKSSISFGFVAVGSSRTEDLKITNVGRSPLNLTGFSFQGFGADQFALQNGSVTTLGPNQSTTITVAFVPTSDGVKHADLVVMSNDPVLPNALVTLTGNGIVSSVEDEAMPTRTAILQSLPSPVRSVARIPVLLQNKAHVRIELFDLLGNSITMLQDGELSAGKHFIAFNATALPSGVYFCRLYTTDVLRVRKIVVDKR
ncbi:choice-of-anchor D domain-containing protein [bacterium]|nr:choice-of-anchor D domain-containing protein [bacterium]